MTPHAEEERQKVAIADLTLEEPTEDQFMQMFGMGDFGSTKNKDHQ